MNKKQIKMFWWNINVEALLGAINKNTREELS